MGVTLSTLVGTLRVPAHTGPNRCYPCTALNLLLVGAAALVVSSYVAAAGVALTVLGAASVWLRGYVVPGTPRITRRLFPERVLAWFDKRPAEREAETVSAALPFDATDPTALLVEVGVLDDTDQPSLAPAFRSSWTATAASLSASPEAVRSAVAEALAVSAESVDISSAEPSVVVTVDGDWVGQWPSRTALVADLATERTLADTDWPELDQVRRASLAARIRAVAARCPVCDGATRVSTETVESCCRETDVVAVACPACEARLAEFEPSHDAFAPGR